jgi:hypothetical protein
MKRRDLHRLVSELAQRAGFDTALLDAATNAMRAQRRMGHELSPLVQSLLASPLAAILSRDNALGEIYQALNEPALQRAYRATARERRKFLDSEIPSVTQLFTPRFVVEFLLEHTLGCVESHRRVRDIRILDPACGTMNFGLVAIEMLDAMYRRELEQLGPSQASVALADEIPHAILQHNLFGIDVDATALDLAAQTLAMKLRIPIEQCRANLWRADALFDPELAARCRGAFDIVVTNPPYLSARNLDPRHVARLKRKFPASWRDAYACFIERSLDFVRDNGRVGILAMQSFMFTGAFHKLREKLAGIAAIERIAHFGPGLFQIGNPGTLQTAAIVLRREPGAQRRSDNVVLAQRIVDEPDKERGIKTAPTYSVRQRDLLASSRLAWVYWLSPAMRKVFAALPKLRDIAEPRQGLATTDNARFVRYWWEVEPTRADAARRASADTWFPYVKSGRFRRWFEPPRHRVNWADNGREIKQSIVERYPYLNGRWEWVAKNSQFYGRAGVTYSYLTAGAFSARLMPAGAIFDVAGSAIFPEDPLTMLAILNSSIASELLHAVNPTVNFQVGDLAELPIPCSHDRELHDLASRAVVIQELIDAGDETSPAFKSPPPWPGGFSKEQAELAELERQINSAVENRYGLQDGNGRVAKAESFSTVELARRWVSFVVGRLLGRWGSDVMLETLPLKPPPDEVVRSELARLTSATDARQIESALSGIGAFLAGPFYSWHLKLYRSRPVYWLLGDSDLARLVLHDFATPQMLPRWMNLPRGWDRSIDDGILTNLAPLAHLVPNTALSRKLRQIGKITPSHETASSRLR